MVGDYWDDRAVDRARLVWAVATRCQLERWEPIVAAFVRELWAERQLEGAAVWAAEREHHFALIAARNLIQALELEPQSSVRVDPTLRAEVIEGRDLHEHWRENMPVFNVTPRVAQPKYRSGKDFAARHPDSGPYWWLDWSNTTGARLMPHVPVPALHDLLDAVEAEVLAKDGSFGEYIPPRAPSPWLHENGEWWPRAEDET